MHAKHADNSEANDLPGHMIDCATIEHDQKNIVVGEFFGKPRLEIKRVAHGL